eukprot:jgi/Bigna1/130453/aug1.11_g5161
MAEGSETTLSWNLLNGIILTEEQKTLLKRFKEILAIPSEPPFDGVQDDITLYRFLSGKKWVIAEAQRQYKHMLQWRQETNIPEVYKWVEDNKEKCDLIKTLYPVQVHGFDKMDRPIVYDGLGMLPAGRYHIHFMEELGKTMRAQTKKIGRAVFQLTAIVDMGGMNASHRHFIQYFKAISKIDQECYPEYIHKVCGCNAPWVFPGLFKFVKGWIDPTTREKIDVFSTGYEETLLELVDEKVLNYRFGGKDQAEVLKVPACILAAPEDELMEAQIQPGSKFEIQLHCNDRRGGSYRWCFSCLKEEEEEEEGEEKAQDVKLQIEWKKSTSTDNKPTVVVHGRRIKTMTEKGTFDVKAKGVLRFILDNPCTVVKTVSYGLLFHSVELLKTNALLVARSRKGKKVPGGKNSTGKQKEAA